MVVPKVAKRETSATAPSTDVAEAGAEMTVKVSEIERWKMRLWMGCVARTENRRHAAGAVVASTPLSRQSARTG